jgi:hypothetical protein
MAKRRPLVSGINNITDDYSSGQAELLKGLKKSGRMVQSE